jgi:hypothetical protein
MQTFYELIGLLSAAFILYLLYTRIKNRPDLFNKANMSKSALTMGFLGLGLIGFVALLVLLLRL